MLARSIHFRDLPADALDALAGLTRLRTLRDGELAASIGERLEELWVVHGGALRLSTVDVQGTEYVYAVLGPGSFYGLAHVIGDSSTIAEARAFGPTELATFNGSAFLALLDRDPRLWRHVANLAFRRMRLAMSVIRDLSTASLAERITRRLLGQAMSASLDIGAPAPIELRLSQTDLSRMLGSSRSKVNAELKRLEKSGMIRIGYRSITLVDLAMLREHAGPDVFSF
jgi:CRP-like cAMP-binding protein